LRRPASAAIHIRLGEKVCIQAMTPMQAGLEVASRHTLSIDSGVVTTGRATTLTGIDGASSSAWAMVWPCSPATRSTSSP